MSKRIGVLIAVSVMVAISVAALARLIWHERPREHVKMDAPNPEAELPKSIGQPSVFAPVLQMPADAVKTAAAPTQITQMKDTSRVATALAGFREATAGGSWEVIANELRQTSRDGGWDRFPNLVFGEKTWSEYDLKVKVKATHPGHGVGVVFHQQQPGDCVYFTLGSYGNTGHDLCFLQSKKWSRPSGMFRRGSIKPDTWYDIQISVRKNRCECRVDGTLMFTCDKLPFDAGQIGFRTWQSECQFKDVVVSRPDGTRIWEGLPDLKREQVDFVAKDAAREVTPNPKIPEPVQRVPENAQKPVLEGANAANGKNAASAQHERMLKGEDFIRVECLKTRIGRLEAELKYDEAAAYCREKLEIHMRVLGKDHWQTVNSFWSADWALRIAALPKEKQEAWRKAAKVEVESNELIRGKKFAQATELAENHLRLCAETLGEDHLVTATAHNNLGFAFYFQGKFKEAEEHFRKALEIRRQVIKTDHPDVASTCSNLGATLAKLGKKEESEKWSTLSRQIEHSVKPPPKKSSPTSEADELSRKIATLSGQAFKLEFDGKLIEAQKAAEDLLLLYIKRSGAEHPEVAEQRITVDRLKKILAMPEAAQEEWKQAAQYRPFVDFTNRDGKYSEALKIVQAALEVSAKLLGDDDPHTIECRAATAVQLARVGKASESAAAFDAAIAATRQVFGNEHSRLVRLYAQRGESLLAANQLEQASAYLGRAYDLMRKTPDRQPGEEAGLSFRLAECFERQARLAEAEALYREALRHFLQKADADNPYRFDNLRNRVGMAKLITYPNDVSIARCFLSIAGVEVQRGNTLESQEMALRSLDLAELIGGEDHPNTVSPRIALAQIWMQLNKFTDAERQLRTAMKIQSGISVDSDTVSSLNLTLAMAIEGQGRTAEAERLYREALKAARERLPASDSTRHGVTSRLARNLWASGNEKEVEALFREALGLVKQTYGEFHPATGYCFRELGTFLLAADKSAEAAGLFEDAARAYEYSRVVSSFRGADRGSLGAQSPYTYLAVARLQLGEPRAAWQAFEADCGRGLLDELGSSDTYLKPTEADRKRELARLIPEVEKRLFDQTLSAKVPTDRKRVAELTAERRHLSSEAAQIAASERQRSVASWDEVRKAIPSDVAIVCWIDVAATNDPFADIWGCVLRSDGEPKWEQLPAFNPEDARLVREFAEGQLTGKNSVDLLARIAAPLASQRLAPLQKHLNGVRRLYVVATHFMAKVPVELLTDKYVVSYLPSATFLARSSNRPLPTGSKALVLADPLFDPSQRVNLAELPATRLEAIEIRRCFDTAATTLPDAEASEKKLDALRTSGELGRYRFLHFATHGIANNTKAFESVIQLSSDRSDDRVLEASKPFIDGRLSAREVLEYWKLNSELVTLSACETALGKVGGGDGMLGFAQAFLTAGARTVCLSLWKVDDTATCLLMSRFYQNLLGKRDGLTKPMPKAEALQEAKEWLRNLPLDEARTLIGEMNKGMPPRNRGTGAKLDLVEPKIVKSEVPAKQSKPFAHPKYWAAFILIGDPN